MKSYGDAECHDDVQKKNAANKKAGGIPAFGNTAGFCLRNEYELSLLCPDYYAAGTKKEQKLAPCGGSMV